MKNLIAGLVLALLFANVAYAQDINTTPMQPTDEQAPPYTYSPDPCEFTVTFPAEPLITHKCEPDNPDTCYDHVTYTQVYGLSSSVNVKVICNAIDEQVKDHYSGEIMQDTLRAMTQDSVVETYDVTFEEAESYKYAGLVGEGQMGKASTMYIAQLWIGTQSALSLEAQMVGDDNDVAGKLLSDILRSVKYDSGLEEESLQ